MFLSGLQAGLFSLALLLVISRIAAAVLKKTKLYRRTKWYDRYRVAYHQVKGRKFRYSAKEAMTILAAKRPYLKSVCVQNPRKRTGGGAYLVSQHVIIVDDENSCEPHNVCVMLHECGHVLQWQTLWMALRNSAMFNVCWSEKHASDIAKSFALELGVSEQDTQILRDLLGYNDAITVAAHKVPDIVAAVLYAAGGVALALHEQPSAAFGYFAAYAALSIYMAINIAVARIGIVAFRRIWRAIRH